MGSKSGTSTQQVTIPPDVLARYNSVNATAEQAATRPFQQYSTDPNDFVAPLNATQQAGIAGTNAYSQTAQPYFGAATNQLMSAQAGTQPYYNVATGMALGSSAAANPSAINSQAINQYMSPYLGSVVGSEANLLNQQNQQAMAGQLGNAIQSGAFGGDRSGIAAANLAQQQQLSNANIFSNLLNQGYGQALQTAQQQQGVQLGAEQANLARLAQGSQLLGGLAGQQYGQGAQTASLLANLGTGAQTAGLQGAQAQMGAGQVSQQTEQAGKTALYNQFLQQQSYPFQVAQFLANIAEGTGSLSGSTTTTQQPGGFFSDKRLKENIEEIGKDFAGKKLYRFNYKGDPRTHVGYIAQEIEKSEPSAVGESHGYKTVDYGKASEAAAHRGHYRSGGLVPESMGGHVGMEHMGEGYADGGMPVLPGVGSSDYAALLQAAQQMYAPFSQAGLYGASGGSPYGGLGHVPQANLPVSHLAVAGGLAPQRTVMQNLGDVANIAKTISDPKVQDLYESVADKISSFFSGPSPEKRGGLVGYADGGDVPDDSKDSQDGLMPYNAVTNKLDIPEEKPDAKLVTATPLQKQDSGLQQLAQIAQIAAAVASMARGGRSNYADGGMPYGGSSPAGGLDIPNESPAAQSLKTASSLPGQPSGLQNTAAVAGLLGGAAQFAGSPLGHAFGAGLASLGSGLASLGGLGAGMGAAADAAGLGAAAGADALSSLGPLALLAARGGRIHKNDGGKAIDGNYIDTFAPADQGGGGDYLKESKNYELSSSGYPVLTDIKNSQQNTVNQQSDYPAIGPDKASSPKDDLTEKALMNQVQKAGLAMVAANKPKTFNDFPEISNNQAAQVGPPAPVAAPPTADQAANAINQEPPSTLDKVAQSVVPSAEAATTGNVAKQPQQNIVDKALGLLKNKQGEYDQQKIIPLLAGIAAMGTAPTRSLGVALASGLGAGTQAYMGTQANLAELARKQAETAAIPQRVSGNVIAELNARAPMGMIAVPGHVEGVADIVGPDGKVYHYAPAIASANMGAFGKPSQTEMASTPINRNDSGNLRIEPTASSNNIMIRDFGYDPKLSPQQNMAMISVNKPGFASANQLAMKDGQRIKEDAYAADANARNFVMLGNAISHLSENSFTGQGPLASERTELANIYNYAARLIGINDQIDPNEVTQQQIIAKLNGLAAPQLAAQFGEKAARVSEALRGVLPGSSQSKDAAMENLSQMMLQNQIFRDKRSYSNNYLARFGTLVGVDDSFNNDMGTVYAKEKSHIRDLFRNPTYKRSAAEEIASNPTAERIIKLERGIKQKDGSYVGGIGNGMARYIF